jgi:hypothetical protein
VARNENGFYIIYALFLRQAPERSSPLFADELRDTGRDYIALGHYHLQIDVGQGGAAYYAGATMTEWRGGHPEATLLRIDVSAEDGIRVDPSRLEMLTIRSSSRISR